MGLSRDLKEYIPEPWRETATFSIEKTDEGTALENGCTLSGSMLTVGEKRTSFEITAFLEEKDKMGMGMRNMRLEL